MQEEQLGPNLPSSGQILGVMVGWLGIKNPMLQDRTARRYFAGQSILEDRKKEIIAAIAESILTALNNETLTLASDWPSETGTA